ncbi:hypothetical protein FGO68_gene11017 [Halteria grandinella]|uniref:Uncharacterized protein n=1 Tax=Halteria grandinella TaxID=5974 RepID=A0A8J8T7P4_HALGN|nr:hypothetical protein FGO68_gene11017 [Halteria grandinella]
MNRCKGITCLADDECGEGLLCFMNECKDKKEVIDYQHGVECSLRSQYSTYVLALDYTLSLNTKPVEQKICDYSSCSCDIQCASGFCNSLVINSSNNKGMCQPYVGIEGQERCNMTSFPMCSSRLDYAMEYPINRCKFVSCQWDGDCKSGFCNMQDRNNQICDNLPITPVSCNQSAQIPASRNLVTGLISYVSSINRCSNVECDQDSDCKDSTICISTCQPCQIDKVFKLCLGSPCINDSQCISNACIKGICQKGLIAPINKTCNESSSYIKLGISYWSTNRCNNVTCLQSSDCQTNRICLYGTCQFPTQDTVNINETSTKMIVYSVRNTSTNMFLLIIVGIMAIILVIALALFFYYKFCRSRNTQTNKVQIEPAQNSTMPVENDARGRVSFVMNTTSVEMIQDNGVPHGHQVIIDPQMQIE